MQQSSPAPRRQRRQDPRRETVVVNDPLPLSSASAAPALIYDLRQGDDTSGRYYTEISAFSDRLLAEIDLRAGDDLRAYGCHVQYELHEPPRTAGEYAIELLTLGLALDRYAGAAESTPGWVVALAQELFWLRRRSAWMKKLLADPLRAALTRYFLAPRIGRAPTPRACMVQSLPTLIDWLNATGEFEQEAERLNNWRSFLLTLPGFEAARLLEAAGDLFQWFRRESVLALGNYTRGVQPFLAGAYAHRGCREDQILCGREPVAYHLGMVAAEVMNRGLRPGFDRTTRRVVLVPACMRGARASSCRARAMGIDITCTACDPACHVNRITRRMRVLGAEVYLIHHAAGFTHFLNRWQLMPEVGVTAVACLLNILPGGYEMRSRRIAAQCIPLDYPGCHKHWCPAGVSTALNEDRLAELVQIAAPPLTAQPS